MMGHTFGLFTKSQKGVTFANIKAQVSQENDLSHPNHPSNPESPNFPRSEIRRYGESDPILGDPGRGQIGRWQTVQLDALENVIDQIIEQYLRDQTWYAKVRCREALWNMYRRIEWWVKNEITPDKTQYQRVLQMIKDCINSILVKESLVFEELFNDVSYSSNFVITGNWKWVDIVAKYGGSGGDGVLMVENSTGTHVLTLSNITLSSGGKLRFQYGGKLFSSNDSFSVWADSGSGLVELSEVLLNPSLAVDSPQEAEVILPPGTNKVEWRFISGSSSSVVWLDVIRVYAGEDSPTHAGVPVPVCPSPYYHFYNGSYLNHFDGRVYERPLFSMVRDVPFSDKFPGFFRYVSSSEEQEWSIVHSVGGENELSGSEMILKLDLNALRDGNSSKITFNWRVKRSGKVRFKYWASSNKGNGLTFFINGVQVGGEWSQMSGWQSAEFNLQPGQTYKFDWLVRRIHPEEWGLNSVYVKDVEVVEVVDTRIPPTPKDVDVEEGAGLQEWWVKSSKSVVRTHYNGTVISQGSERTLVIPMDNECDGQISFSYRLGRENQPYPQSDYDLIYDERFTSYADHQAGEHGSYVDSLFDQNWVIDGEKGFTGKNGAKITYNVVVDGRSTVDLEGTLQVVCPAREIDHYEPFVVGSMANFPWSMSGEFLWRWDGYNLLSVDNPVQGKGIASTSVTIEDDGWLTFSYEHDLRPTEHFEVLVDGQSVWWTEGYSSGTQVVIPISKGTHSIKFVIADTKTEQPISMGVNGAFSYGRYTGGKTYSFSSPLGSYFSVTRNWDVNDAGATTETDGDSVVYNISLNPGATWTLRESMRVYPALTPPDQSGEAGGNRLIFSEDFNDKDKISPQLEMSPNWEWDYQVAGNTGDGAIFIRDKHGSRNTVKLANVLLSKPGYVSFQYGGDFAYSERLQLKMDGKVIWTGVSSSQSNVLVPVPSGVHDFEWVYNDGFSFVNEQPTPPPPPTGGGTTENPYGEICYPSGSERHSLNYANLGGGFSTARTFQFYTGGNDGATSYIDTNTGAVIAHGSSVDGGTVTRDIYIPEFGDVNFRERVKVYPPDPELVKVNSLRELNTKKYFDIEPYKTPTYYDRNLGYYSLHVYDVEPGNGNSEFDSIHTRKIWYEFYTTGDIDVDFKYLAYLVDNGVGVARLRAYLEEKSTGKRIMLLDERNNVGPRKQYWTLDQADWDSAPRKRYTKKVSPGWYRLMFGLTDIRTDNDRDSEGIFYHGSIYSVNLKVSDPDGLNGYRLVNRDEARAKTYVEGILIDKSTGSVVYSTTFTPGYNGAVGDYIIDWGKYMQSGHSYLLKYVLHRESTIPGGKGGMFSVSEGAIDEYWSDYCTDVNGNVYAKGGSPHPPYNPDYPVEAELPYDNSWVFLDVIRVYENSLYPCSGSEIVVSVYEDGVYREDLSQTVASPHETEVIISVENTGTVAHQYEVRVTFRQGCPGDGGQIWGGVWELNDVDTPDPSWCNVWDFTVVDNKPIWYGGCDGSKVNVQVIREDGVVVFSQDYFDGYGSFSVSDLPPLPYTKYRVEITTTQSGQISPVTGKRYYSMFILHDFKVYEEWKYVPPPFNSQLLFYIDGQLVQTFTEEGGFFEFSYPVPKGQHEFKWVFSSLVPNGERTWDFAELDYVQLTNWICGSRLVTPYCEEGGGDKCIEALIKCLLTVWKARPKYCVIGKRIWIFT